MEKGLRRITAIVLTFALILTTFVFDIGVSYASEETEPNYLTFTAKSTSTIWMDTPMANMEYSLDGTTWSIYSRASIRLNSGDSVQFRAQTTGEGDGTNTFTMSGIIEASGSVTSLIDKNGSNENVVIPQKAFYELFKNCTSLTSAPELPALYLASSCYGSMFVGCTALKTAPELPATTLAPSCYSNMFNGCTRLTTAPELPATILESGCYSYMFNGCTALRTAPELPATALANSCYSSMFSLCTALSMAPELPATTLAPSCYSFMFNGCTTLTAAPELPATTLAPSCYSYMFKGCTALRTAPELPATALATGCYSYMFNGCTALRTAPELPATALESGCYSYMFNGCTALRTAPELPATALESGCYYYMFNGCTTLTAAPELPAKALTSACYKGMFYGCTGLKTASELPATILESSCYSDMFNGCTGLTAAPELPATILADSCYSSMFAGCSTLKTAPSLPAKELKTSCYEAMFTRCTALISAPKLPVTKLAPACCRSMFKDCSRLDVIGSSTELENKELVFPKASEIPGYLASSIEEMFTGTKQISTTYYFICYYNNQPTILNLSIKSGSEYKVDYNEGDELDVTGLYITEHFNDGTTKDVEVTADMVSGFDSSRAERGQVLKITYDSMSVMFSVDINQTVDALDLSEMIAAPVKSDLAQTSITSDQYTGKVIWTPATLNGRFLGGTEYTAIVVLNPKAAYTFDGIAENSFTYSGAAVTNSENTGIVKITFPATEAAVLSSIKIKDGVSPNTYYTIGDDLNLTGLYITAQYDDGTTEDIKVTSEMVSGFDSTNPVEDQEITISYNGKTTSYHIQISDCTTHRLVTTPAKAPTCTEIGWDEYVTCTRCGYTTYASIPALGHEEGDWTVDVKATTTAGSMCKECNRCHTKVETKEIPAIKTVKLSASKYTYSGTTKKPMVTVTDTMGNILEAGTDYVVTYASGRKLPGKYKVAVSFVGNYAGSKNLYFTIVPKAPTVKSIAVGSSKMTIKASNKPSANGASYYQIRYRVKGTSTWKYTTTSTYYKTIKSLKKGKYYQVQIRAYKTVSGAKYYSAWSKTKVSGKIK